MSNPLWKVNANFDVEDSVRCQILTYQGRVCLCFFSHLLSSVVFISQDVQAAQQYLALLQGKSSFIILSNKLTNFEDDLNVIPLGWASWCYFP